MKKKCYKVNCRNQRTMFDIEHVSEYDQKGKEGNKLISRKKMKKKDTIIRKEEKEKEKKKMDQQSKKKEKKREKSSKNYRE